MITSSSTSPFTWFEPEPEKTLTIAEKIKRVMEENLEISRKRRDLKALQYLFKRGSKEYKLEFSMTSNRIVVNRRYKNTKKYFFEGYIMLKPLKDFFPIIKESDYTKSRVIHEK